MSAASNMREIDKKFISLRTNLRKHRSTICEDVFKRFHPSTDNPGSEICVFCNSTLKLTREHVLPKWLLHNDTKAQFVSSVNGLTQTYNKAVVPSCSICNNEILADIERHIIEVTKRLETAESYNYNDLCDIIRWLEIIDYKAQVFDCRRKFLKFPNSEYDSDWGIFSIAMMRHFVEMNPFRAFDFLRSTQKRITIKNKLQHTNSLVIFHTRKSHFNFFIQPNSYIFVSLPTFKVAFFCFFRKRFDKPEHANREAYNIMIKVFNS